LDNKKQMDTMRMRYLAPFVLSAMFLAACGGGDKSADKKDEAAATATTNTNDATNVDNSMVDQKTAAAANSKGAALMDQKDCKTCHKIDMKLVGPAYKDVAAKYPATDANIDMLADKVIKGGSGHWGEVAMTPHPDLSKDDAKELVKYILSLK
jgi:cytochrome c